MADAITQTITTDSNTVLSVINSVLPVLESNVSAIGANAQTIQLAVSGASALVSLINLLPTGGTVTVATQAALLARVYALISGGSPLGAEWKIQT